MAKIVRKQKPILQAKGKYIKYCNMLGVPIDATAQEIKKAFAELSHKYHPDKVPEDTLAEEKYQKIVEAAGVLRNLAKYDSPFTRIAKTYENDLVSMYQVFSVINEFAEDIEQEFVNRGIFDSKEELYEYYNDETRFKLSPKDDKLLGDFLKIIIDKENIITRDDAAGLESWDKFDEWIMRLQKFLEKNNIPYDKEKWAVVLDRGIREMVEGQQEFIGELIEKQR